MLPKKKNGGLPIATSPGHNLFSFLPAWCSVALMDSNLSQFISEIWRYRPIIIVLLVGGFVIFVLSVIDTHRHRKQIHKRRHRGKHH